MNKKFISNADTSVRMFKSDLLEALSKVHFLVPVFIYLPIILICFYITWQDEISFEERFFYAVCGLITWTIVEYLMHRFVFHFVPKGRLGERIHFIIHGVHHDYPNDAKRLVMPPSVSIPLAIMFFSLFHWLVPAEGLWPLYAFFLMGYLVYDLGHYAMHHYNFKNPVFKAIKRNHMLHHYQDAEKGYGVSSALWDLVLATDFDRKKKEEANPGNDYSSSHAEGNQLNIHK